MELVFAAASAAVALLVQGALKTIGEKSGGASWDAGKAVLDRVRSRFSGDPEAEVVLSELEEAPGEESSQESVHRMLVSYMVRDQRFREELVELLEKAKGEVPPGTSINANVIKNANVFNQKVEISGDWNS
ncbi:hypothetical protein [Nocardiopsis sp. CC223A]|uniref:hypothetical protein n=1 Tax=Nocardiopsis sp. CC223A TaxID=3044051 RepID=UPI00278C44ED|nr:hypothetical protein [Nocardiopsis sp. CC223A]